MHVVRAVRMGGTPMDVKQRLKKKILLLLLGQLVGDRTAASVHERLLMSIRV